MAVVSIVPFHTGSALAAESPSYEWQTVPFAGGGYVDGFLFHPKIPGVLYARTDMGGLYRYDYQEQQWSPLFDNFPRDDRELMSVLAIALDPNDSNKIYAACGASLGEWARKGAVLRSNDQGRTWQKFDLPFKLGGNAEGRGTGERLAVDPRNGKVIYLGSNQNGLWTSTDGGASFASVSFPSKSVSLVAVDPRDGAIYAGSADKSGALLLSTDGGKSFAPAPGTPSMIPQRLAFAKDGSIYVTFGHGDADGEVNPNNVARGGLWKRSPDGQWKDVTPVRPDGNAKFGYSGVDVGPDGTVAVSTIDRWWPGDDVFISHDGGEHWLGLKNKSNSNYETYPWTKDLMGKQDSMGGKISDLKINPFNGDEMIYVGPWISTNLSEARSAKPVNFEFLSQNLEQAIVTQLVSPLKGAKVLASMADTAGAAWFDITQPPSKGLFHPTSESNPSVDYAGLKPGFVVRTAEHGNTFGYYSVNGGQDWKPLPGSVFDAPKWKQNWHTGGFIAVSASASSMLWSAGNGAASYSTDGGKTWKESQGWPAVEQHLVPISDKKADGVYYVFDPSGSILISVDSGATFKPIVVGLTKVQVWESAHLAAVPDRVRDLWLTYPGGLIHSPNADAPGKGIKTVNAAYAIGFGAALTPGKYPAVYLSGKVNGVEGLWRSDDEGDNWVRINDDEHRFEPVGAIAGDFREPGRVYIAPGRGGIMTGKPKTQP